MMTKNLTTTLNSAISKLSQKQAITLLISIIFFIFILWHNFFWQELKKNKNDITIKIITTQKEIALLKEAIAKQKREIHEPPKIITKTNNLNLSHLKNYVISNDEMQKVFASILSGKESLKLLLELHNLPSQKINDPLNPNIFLYQHNFNIKMNANYFSTINFLKYLEQLPWPLFLDTIEYKVTEYPIAEIQLQLHVLSEQGELFHV